MTESLLVFISGLGLGALASGHCALMCGGLVASLRLCSARHSPLLWVGRLISYSTLGAIAGSALQILPRSELADSVVRVVFASTLLMAMFMLRTPRLLIAPAASGLARSAASLWAQHLGPHARALAARTSGGARLGLGLLWGLLPCAALHTTLVAASISGSAGNGGLLLFGFAAGTSPVLWWTERRLGLPIAALRWALLLLPLPLIAHPTVLPWLMDCLR